MASGQGVTGSQAAAGVSGGGNNNQQRWQRNATITQIGPITPTLDPMFHRRAEFLAPFVSPGQPHTEPDDQPDREHTELLRESFSRA